MQHDVRKNQDGTWEVFEAGTGKVASLGALRLNHLDHDEAVAALEMLRSRFVQAARRKDESER